MTFFPWDAINSLENKAEEALKQAHTEDFRARVDKYIDEVTELFEMDFMLGVQDASLQIGVGVDLNYEDIKAALDRKIDGKDYKERLNDYFANGTPYDIARVVATDAHRIYNEALFEAGKKGGATQKTWHTMLDPRVRDSHDYLEGVTVGIDEEFYTYNGNHTYYPGQFGVAEEDINCRCWVTLK